MQKILLLEDDITLGSGICLALQGPSVQITLCRTLAQARAAVAENSYDLLILDVNLPDGDGFSLFERLRRQSDVPVLFLSARDEDEARRMLNLLSGRTHQVVTGVALALPNGETLRDATVTKVTFAPLVRREVSDYIRSGEPMDKAGAYGIQGLGGLLVEKINGDYYNIVGLPIAALSRALAEFDK